MSPRTGWRGSRGLRDTGTLSQMLVLGFFAIAALHAQAPPACTPVPGAEAILRPGVVLLLGEIHGTREAPEAVARLSCLALEKGLPITVALEIPRAEQGRIDAYLSGDEKALVEGEFWTRVYQDGRSSRAMMNLIATLRGYRGPDGGPHLVALDDPDSEAGRDAAMARGLDEIASESPERAVIALTGNIHNRLSRGIRWDADYEPMGYRLARSSSGREIVSLNLTHAGGTAWICTGARVEDCGIREIRGIENVAVGIELFAASTDRDQAFSGTYHLGEVAASPPAVETHTRSPDE